MINFLLMHPAISISQLTSTDDGTQKVVGNYLRKSNFASYRVNFFLSNRETFHSVDNFSISPGFWEAVEVFQQVANFFLRIENTRHTMSLFAAKIWPT